MFILFCIHADAQVPAGNTSNGPNLRFRQMAVKGDSLRLDTLSIIPGSVQIKDIIAADYQIDLVNAILVWNRKPVFDSIQISYRVFPFKLNAVTSRMTYDSVKTKFYVTNA